LFNADTLAVASIILSLLNTIAVFVSVLIAIPQLREIGRSGKLQSTIIFLAKIGESEKARAYVLRLPSTERGLKSLSKEGEAKVRQAISALNEVGLLLENNIIDRKMFFGIYHADIIRLWYKIKPFAELEERRRGGHYARRLLRLDKRAKLYHDINPYHRKTVIRYKTGKRSYIIYETDVKKGLKGLVQRFAWFIRRVFRSY
jgi:hypothetical protein